MDTNFEHIRNITVRKDIIGQTIPYSKRSVEERTFNVVCFYRSILEIIFMRRCGKASVSGKYIYAMLMIITIEGSKTDDIFTAHM